MMSSLMAMLISMMIMMIFILLAKKVSYNKEKSTPFECGFDSFSTGRIPFSLRFFKITLIFLIFDIEIIIILPSPLVMNMNMNFLISFSTIMIIIMLGLFYEWKIGSLNWIK